MLFHGYTFSALKKQIPNIFDWGKGQSVEYYEV